jgi:tRNA pseudouridine55 synthase
LNIDKPAGPTSRDVVNQIQEMVRPNKVGHAGTLDPLATGVLVVAVGPATRLVDYVQRFSKEYLGVFLLGRSSPSFDVDTATSELPHPPVPSREELEAVLPRFQGTILQTPPAFSAVKVSGRRAHELARRGEAPPLVAREVTIHELRVERYDYPMLELRIVCSSGTYVRSLGHDLAVALGTDAVMSALRRLAVGPFRVEEAVPPMGLAPEAIKQYLLSPLLALGSMPRVTLSADELRRVGLGQTIADHWQLGAAEVAALDEKGRLMAILMPAGGGQLRPEKTFPYDHA